MTRFVSGEAEMEENPILKASLSMASDIPLYAQLTGIIKNTTDPIKVLGDGEITKALTVRVDKVSASAKAKIEAVGGKVEAPC